MVTGDLKINKKKLEEWLGIAGMTESQLAKEMGIDSGNFSRMLNNVIPTSKSVIEKILTRTRLPVNSILIFKEYAEKQA